MTGDPLPRADALADRLGARVVIHEVVGSTMDAARDDRGPLPVVHLAERQTAGRGRRGRVWKSPPGNLYATIGWPDPEPALPATVLSALQIEWSRAIEAAGGPRTTCKWPNDGILAGGKWAGVLALTSRGPQGARLLVGLGANLTVAPDPSFDGPPPVALAAHWLPWPGRERVVTLLLEVALDVLRKGPRAVADALARWDRRDALEPGQALAVETPGGARRGRYAGVSPDGRLRLETAGGTLSLAVGEVVRLATPR